MPRSRASSVLIAALAVAGCGHSSATVTDAGPTDTRSSGTDAPMDALGMNDVSTDSDDSEDADGPTDAGPPSTLPLTAPSEQWTWVPIAGARCGNGQLTGIGVNLTTRSTRVLIYLAGGGICWNAITCFSVQTASYFTTGYGETDFSTEVADPGYISLPGGMFDRTSTANPFQDYSFIYVPYCTGDVHAGNNIVNYGAATDAWHVGFANIGLYLDRIVPTFPSASRVYLAGSSGGGFGALFNWYRTQRSFGSIRVDLIDDSGTPMPLSVEGTDGNFAQAATSWGLAANLPPHCPDCATNLDHVVGWLAQQYPTHRAALLQYEMDTVLPTYFGISPQQFDTGLNDVIASQIAPNANFHYFEEAMAGDVLWFSPQLSENGVTVQQFLTLMTTDDPSWTSAHP